MSSIDDIREVLYTSKPELLTKFHVKNLAVFGSYARNEQRSDSDIDILVEFTEPVGIEFVDLANYLERLLGRRVDLVSRKGIKPKYFEKIKGDLQYV
ncbi:MAG: nucleotidyltransferase family protein [Acidobacteriota bacterium]|nr:MAG: nucleotidyltransferase family protein [Acidobacteriota bacterium]